MKNILNFFNRILGLDGANEGYIGLTSFEKPLDNAGRSQVKKEEPEVKTSFTGLLRRVS